MIEKIVIKFMTVLAEMTGRKLSDFLIDFYCDELHDLEPQALEVAFKQFMRKQHFPSVDDIRAACGKVDVSPEQECREVAERIWGAIEKFGWCNGQRAREYIGELGWAVVNQEGGWEAVCNANEDQKTSLKAQWREAAKIVQLRALNGTLGQAPALPTPKDQKTLESAKDVLAQLIPMRKAE